MRSGMTFMSENSQRQPVSAAETGYRPVPAGYRQGIITAIAVLLGFSLAFFRYWGFEASGAWTPGSIIPASTFVAGIVLQIIALFRSLRLEDEDVRQYQKTVAWFVASAIVLLTGLLIAAVVYSAGN